MLPKTILSFANINIYFSLGNIRRNLPKDCEKIPLIKELLDIIRRDETAVVKALYFLEIDSRENNQINFEEEADIINEKKNEFGYEGKYVFSAFQIDYTLYNLDCR